MSEDDNYDFSSVLENMSSSGVFAIDRRLNVIFWNRFMEIHSKLKATEVLNKNICSFFPELKEDWFAKKARSVIVLGNQSYTNWTQRPYLLHFPTTQYSIGKVDHMYQNCSMWPLKNTAGVIQGVCVSIHDVTEMAISNLLLEEVTEQMLTLEETSNRDEMTGLYNRRYFFEQLHYDKERAKRYHWPLTYAIFDVDKFKLINDRYGHPVGDQVLIEIAKRIQSCLRGSDTLCRFGGEEFVLILPNLSRTFCTYMLNRLRAIIADSPFLVNNHQINVTISIGACIFDFNDPLKDTLSCADKALYKAKNQGRNAVIFAD